MKINKDFTISKVTYYCLVIVMIMVCLAGVFMTSANRPELVFEENINKVVEIKVADDESTYGYATGFFVDKNGTIITNKHVVINSETKQPYKKILVATATEEEFIQAEVVKVSETDDIAMIRVDKKKTTHFKFAKGVENGERIYTIGNPSGFGLSFTEGVVSSNSRNVIYNGQTINCIQAGLVINEGNSGGPVFNINGELVGIISFRLKDNKNEIIQGCAFVIPVQTIKNFI